MYKYFSELDNPNNFKICLERSNLDSRVEHYLNGISLSPEFLLQHSELFERLKFLDIIIKGHNENLINCIMSEEQLLVDEFFLYKDEDYWCTRQLNEKLNLDLSELKSLLRSYSVYCNYFVDMYTELNEFLSSTRKLIHGTLNQIDKKDSIEIPVLNSGVELEWPNAWYITPSGYLYNTGGENGHKEGNLIYPFYYTICDALKNDKVIPNKNYFSQIRNILKRGYVTAEEFRFYSNTSYKLPTIFTPQVEVDIKRYNNIINMVDGESEIFSGIDSVYLPHPERSYQANINKLVVGHLAAETGLFNSFVRMNCSSRKPALFGKLSELTNGDLSDVLVRYCGFNKIESVVDRTITTSSLNGIEEFKKYLDRGWDLHIVPGIVYDKYIDDLSKVDFNSYFVSRYLDEQLEEYDGKGKVLIFDI